MVTETKARDIYATETSECVSLLKAQSLLSWMMDSDRDLILKTLVIDRRSGPHVEAQLHFTLDGDLAKRFMEDLVRDTP